MAMRELKSICRDARGAYPGVARLVAVHVLGECPVGSASVVVGCNSPHRHEAIRCTEYLIDELKARVPIWKKEVYEGDEEKSVWKENVEWREGRRRRVMVKVVGGGEEEDDDERGMKA
jgi:molybdopterin synthase catalytic subunit